MSLEENIEKLESLATAMESADVTLEQSLAIFEEGVKLADECLSEIKSFRGKLVVLQDKIKKLTEDE